MAQLWKRLCCLKPFVSTTETDSEPHNSLWGGPGSGAFPPAATPLAAPAGHAGRTGLPQLPWCKGILLRDFSAIPLAERKAWDGFQGPGFSRSLAHCMGVASERAPPLLCAGEDLAQSLKKVTSSSGVVHAFRALSLSGCVSDRYGVYLTI